jgi:3-hydroxyacyl-CoA dehydrogenase
MNLIHSENVAGVAVLRIVNPPVNSLSQAVRASLLDAIDRALDDNAVTAVILTGDSANFSAGADIQEFAGGLRGGAFASPGLGDVCNRIAGARKPIVAVIRGVCMGGGLELALSCARRVLSQDARLALPEIKLGLIPGAGGTQRLPRLAGVASALRLILSGETINADEAARLGIGSLSLGNPLEAAIQEATQLTSDDSPPYGSVGDIPWAHPDEDREAALQTAATRLPNPSAAERGALTAVRAAIELPLREGLAREFATFRELIQSPESRALQYAFFSDRRASKLGASGGNSEIRDVRRVCVVGAGTMGAGIAMCTANAGIPVTLIDASPEALARALSRIDSTYATAVEKGRLTAATAQERRSRITGATNLDEVSNADLVIEAVPESLDLKRSVFSQIDEIAPSGAVLATNTSTLDVNAIAAATKRPSSVIGLHFFSPAHIMRLLEVVRADASSDSTIACAMAFAKRLGKVAVLARVCDGFIGNRMFEEYSRQAFFMLDEGARPELIDGALERWGMAMGPLAVIDLAGGDIPWAIRQRRALEQPDRPYSRIPDLICERGRFGQKTGAGFYLYDPKTRKRATDPAIHDLIAAHARELGMPNRQLDESEIVDRCVLALINEGARLLEEGIAQRASDIDVVYRHGYGFPAVRGGPMFVADEMGLAEVIATMERFASGYQGQLWQVAPLIRRCAAEGRRLSDV